MTKSSKLILSNQNKLLQEEKERLRKLRLIQVREISKQNAALVRTSYQAKKEQEIKRALEKYKIVHNEQHKEGLKQMQHLVESHIDNIGQGHQNAAKYDDKLDERLKQQAENKELAALRGKFALEVHREERQEVENKENAHIIARQFALEQEKLRASYVAKLPPKPNEFEDCEKKTNKTNKKPAKMVAYHDANAYTTTRYHMPKSCVDKQIHMDTIDARQEALNEENRLSAIEMSQTRQTQERMEKARLRGKHALEKEILNENYNEILTELNVLEKADREKRQKELMNIPKEIFLPAWQRQQDKNEKQLELEREFEKIYANSNLRAEHEIPQPVDLKQLEISQSNLEDADLDITLVDDTLNKTQIPNPNAIDTNTENANTNKPNVNHTEPEEPIRQPTVDAQNITTASQQTTSSRSTENAALAKLLDKINKQREERAKQQSVSFTRPKSIKSDKTDEKQTSNADETVESELWSTPNSSMKLNDNDEPEKDSNNENESLILTSESFKSSNESLVSNADAQQVTHNKNMKLKQIRGIMMSSHNVSSLNEIEQHACRRRAVLSKNIRVATSSDANQSVCVANTATYSVDLSHASRDQMLAGSKEVFDPSQQSKQEVAERKFKLIDSKQQELERRLRDLEQKETELRQARELEEQSKLSLNNQKQQQQVINNKKLPSESTGCDSGNDHNYCSDSVESFTPRVHSREELKRIEYQQMLLKSASEKQFQKLAVKSDETSSECSNSTTTNRLEERKKEILKRFGLSQELLARKPPPAPVSLVNSDDKHTSGGSVADSGFSSTLTRSLNNLNKQLEVEKQSQKSAKLQQQNDDDLLAYLSTSNLDKEELLRRLSSGSSSSLFGSADNSKLNEQNLHRLFGLEFFESPNLRDLSVEKLIELNRLNDLSSSSNDTSNDGDIDSNHENSSLIITLLNSRKQQQQQQKLSEQEMIDLKREQILEQLDLVRQKKDELQQSQHRLSIPLKSNQKSFSELNLHELSTIKEVDTPISERNLKVNQTKGTSNVNNKSLLNDVSSSFALSESSLENVTQLSENNNNNNQQFHTSLKSIKEQTDSFSSSNSTKSIASVCTNTSTPLQQQSNLMSVNTMRQKQMQLFDVSLFDEYSSCSNSSPTKLSKNMSSLRLTEYGAQIYDDLSTNNLDSSHQLVNSTRKQTNNSVAFKTESSNGSLDLSAMKQRIISRKSDLINSNKKWLDILASSDEDNSNGHNQTSLNSQSNNNMTLLSEQSTSYLKQYSIDSTNQSMKLERTLDQYKSPPPKKLTKESETAANSGLFDQFIQSYTGQSSSVQDEPELSFVSYKTTSNPVSPTKKTTFVSLSSCTDSSSNQTCSYALSACSSSKSNQSDLSLIQMQQKQLNKQFANLSPIDKSKLTNTKMSSCVDFTLFDSSKSNEETSNSKNDVTSSLILFSPEDSKIEDKTNPFIKFDEKDYTLLADSTATNSYGEVESALTGVTSFVDNTKRKMTSKSTMLTSALEPIQDISGSTNNGSLVSFEQHELTQCTPISQKFKTNSTPLTNKLNFSSSSSTNETF